MPVKLKKREYTHYLYITHTAVICQTDFFDFLELTKYSMVMTVNDICIILTHPDESRNIGSVCRAMANMGITDLRIVGKRSDYKDRQVRILAIHAAYIWDNARFFDTITEAAADCTVAAGTTRRRGKKRKEWLVTPEEFASQVAQQHSGMKIALVFGNERTGLTDEELSECTIGINIPSCPDFPSLNLSHAVQVMCYVMYRTLETADVTGYTPITLGRLDKTVTTITDDLQKIGFFKVTGREEMEQFWQSVLSRAILSEGEAAYIEKIFNKAAGLASKATKSDMSETQPVTDMPEPQAEKLNANTDSGE